MSDYTPPPFFQDTNSSFVYYTECQLATLADLCIKSRTPKHQKLRQQTIAAGMLLTCFRDIFNADFLLDRTLRCGRVKFLIGAIREAQQTAHKGQSEDRFTQYHLIYSVLGCWIRDHVTG